MRILYDVLKTDLGTYYIVFAKKGILRVNLFQEQFKKEFPTIKKGTFFEAVLQLSEYFKGERKKFNLPLQPFGTFFQKKVWQKTCEIPYGETRSYKWVAKNIDNINAARAVGNALGANPIPIIIPCHRVIKNNNDIGGFSGPPGFKQKLLDLENPYR